MGADAAGRAARGVGAATLVALSLLPGGRAGAQPLTGQLQVQYQNIEQRVQVLNPDGTRRDTILTREYWVQNYELNHAARIGEQLNIVSQLRLSDLAYIGRPDKTRTPYGALRLAHRVFGLSGSYRPTTVTTVLAPGFFEGGLAAAPPVLTTARTQEGVLSGYLAPVGLPRLDLSWIRRHRGADERLPGETGVSRNARLAYGFGGLSVRGGYDDLSRDPGDPALRQMLQRSLNGGAGLTLAPASALSIAMQYDFAATRRGVASPNAERARTHGATLNGSLRQSERANWNLAYAFRRSEIRSRVRSDLDDHDGSLLFNYTPGRATRLSVGGGARTVRTSARNELQRHLALIASADGRVLRGWTGTVSLSHATNWNPERRVFSVESFRVGSRFHLATGLDLDADLQATANGDTAARDSRVVTQGSFGVQATPLRSISLRYSARSYRVGPGLFRAAGDARSSTLDLRWRPLATLEMAGSLSRSGTLAHGGPRLASRQANLSWRPGPMLQFSGNYARSDQRATGGSAEQITGREILGARVQAGLGRRLTLNAGINQADPGGRSASRQYDAAVTRSFGR